jgi:hypothetical protein
MTILLEALASLGTMWQLDYVRFVEAHSQGGMAELG